MRLGYDVLHVRLRVASQGRYRACSLCRAGCTGQDGEASASTAVCLPRGTAGGEEVAAAGGGGEGMAPLEACDAAADVLACLSRLQHAAWLHAAASAGEAHRLQEEGEQREERPIGSITELARA